MNITCPYCQSRLEAPDELIAGSKVSCTVCHKSFECPSGYDLPAYNEKAVLVPIVPGVEEENMPRDQEIRSEGIRRGNTKRERNRNRRISDEVRENEQLGFLDKMVYFLRFLSLFFLVLALLSLLVNDRSDPIVKSIPFLSFGRMLESAFLLFMLSCFLRILHIIACRLGRLNEEE